VTVRAPRVPIATIVPRSSIHGKELPAGAVPLPVFGGLGAVPPEAIVVVADGLVVVVGCWVVVGDGLGVVVGWVAVAVGLGVLVAVAVFVALAVGLGVLVALAVEVALRVAVAVAVTVI